MLWIKVEMLTEENFANPVVDALRRFFILSLRKYMHEKSDIASCRR
jgi:hypothetical protein